MKQITIFLFLVAGAGRSVLAQPNVTAWNVLTDGLSEKYVENRRQAITAIASIGETPEVVQVLTGTLRDDNVLIRMTTAAAMGQMKCRSCIPALEAAIGDESGEVAFAVAEALWEMGDRRGRGVLEDIVTGTRKDSPGFAESAKRDAIKTVHDPRAMTLIGARTAAGLLLGPAGMGIYVADRATRDGTVTGKTLAAAMLGEDCDARGLQLLEWNLDHESNWTVKAASARAVGRCGDKEAIAKLETKLDDSHRAVRFMSAAAIIRLSLQPSTDPRAGELHRQSEPERQP